MKAYKMDDKKKILLLGGEGFIGRNIANAVANESLCYSMGVEKSLFDKGRRDTYIHGNPYVEKIDEKFDAYVHLIDNQAAGDTFEESESGLIGNIGFPSGSHLVIFSSAVIYANPGSPYAARKTRLEELYGKYCKENDINLTILRLFNIYGDFQLPYRQGSLMANIFFNHLNGIPIEINDMEAKRDFIYAKDMGNIVKWVIDNKFYGKHDLATGKLISIRELLEIFTKDVFSEKPEIIEKNIAENNVCPVGSDELYGKIEQTSLKSGLAETRSFYEKNAEVIKKHISE